MSDIVCKLTLKIENLWEAGVGLLSHKENMGAYSSQLKLATQKVKLYTMFYHKKNKIQIYKAARCIYSLLLCALYSGTIIIKKTKYIPGWLNILCFKCRIGVDWMCWI